jgi:hypothetical protein
VRAEEALPAQIERVLSGRGERVAVANLGFNSEGAYAFADTNSRLSAPAAGHDRALRGIQRSARRHTNRLQRRHGSPIFRLTGYFPMLPIVLRDKADSMARGGSGGRVVFGVAADAIEGLGRQLGRLSDHPADAQSPAAANRWHAYCDAVTRAVAEARLQGASVLVVSQPYISDSHVEQQHALAGALSRFAGDPRVRYFDAGRAIDLHDTQFAFDGMHLTPEGNRRMAEVLAAPLLALRPGGRGEEDRARGRGPPELHEDRAADGCARAADGLRAGLVEYRTALRREHGRQLLQASCSCRVPIATWVSDRARMPAQTARVMTGFEEVCLGNGRIWSSSSATSTRRWRRRWSRPS